MSTDINSPEENVTTESMPPESKTTETTEQVKEVLAKVASVLGDAPEYVVETFNEYKRPLTVISLVLGVLVGIKMTFAILSAINDIPILAPTMELVGLLYTGWFLYRYLLKASNRSDLLNSLGEVKDQITGKQMTDK